MSRGYAMTKKMKNQNITKLGWPVPTNIHESFTTFCDDNGLSYQDAIAAAMLLFLHIPATLREQGIRAAKGKGQIDLVFWRSLDNGQILSIKELTARLRKKQRQT